MKMKIISIFIFLMLITAFLTTAQDVENIPVTHESDENEPILFNQVGTPVWEVGYKWRYKINSLNVDFEEEGISLHMYVEIDNLSLEVTKDTGDFYELTFKSTIIGSFWIIFDLGQGPINVSFDLKGSTIEGTILSRKADLGLKEIHVTILGSIDVEIVDQPYITMPFRLHQEIEGTINLDIVMEEPRQPILKFPFEIFEYWGLPADNYTLGGTIESPLLDQIDNLNRKYVNPILNFLNNTFNGPRIERLYEFSNILKDIFPIIDICQVLTDYLNRSCEFNISEVDPIIFCIGKEEVTVPAGTFEAYNVSIALGELGIIFYNETIGAIVKVIGNFEAIFPSINNLNVELISYDYPS